MHADAPAQQVVPQLAVGGVVGVEDGGQVVAREEIAVEVFASLAVGIIEASGEDIPEEAEIPIVELAAEGEETFLLEEGDDMLGIHLHHPFLYHLDGIDVGLHIATGLGTAIHDFTEGIE